MSEGGAAPRSPQRRSGSDASDPAELPPVPKKKKRKPAQAGSGRPGPIEPAAAEPAAAASEGEAYVPSFARAFPRHPELDALVAAFEEGNYARVRADAPALAARADEPEAVRDAARELRKRLDPDPLAAVMIALSVALLAFFSIYYWTHGHGPP